MVTHLDSKKNRSPIVIGLTASVAFHLILGGCIALLMQEGGPAGNTGTENPVNLTQLDLPRTPTPRKPRPLLPRSAPTARSFDLSQAGLALPTPTGSTSSAFSDTPEERPTATSIGLRNADDPRFFSFVSRLTDRIGMNLARELQFRLYPFSHLHRHYRGRRFQALVEMELNPDGEITRTTLLSSSGDTVLDAASVQSIIKVLRAPNPPTALFTGDDKRNTLVYSFTYDFTN